MAVRIAQAGIPLTVWARRPEATNACVAAGAAVAENLAGLGAASDVLGVCVFDDAQVIEVCEAAAPSMAKGSVILIHATVRPDTCRQVAAMAAEHGVRLLDAPVSGGSSGARAGTLAVMVGGDEDLLEACRPVIQSYAGLIVRLGDIGAGQAAKLINNNLLAAQFGLAHMAVNAGERLGLDPAMLNKVIAASSGKSRAHDLYAAAPLAKTFSRGSRLLSKDVGLLSELAEATEIDIAELHAAAAAFLRALDAIPRPSLQSASDG